MIKVLAKDIGAQGLDVEATVKGDEIGLTKDDVELKSSIKIKAHLERADESIIGRADIEADYSYICARCLEGFIKTEQHHYQLYFDVDSGLEYLDLGEEIRQEILLDVPARALCKPDCKGICEECGKNLNNEQCTCQ